MRAKFSRRQFITLSMAALTFVLVAGQAAAKGEKAQAKAKQKIQQVFREVLGREAGEADIKLHMDMAMRGELKPQEFRKAIVMSEECTLAVTRVFKQELGHDPKNKQLARAKAGLIEGSTLEDLRQELRR